MRLGSAVALLVMSVWTMASEARPDLERSPLYGALDAGPYAVGFTRLTFVDPARPVRPKRTPAGALAPADRGRRIEAHVWYPAAPGGVPLTLRDYLTVHDEPGDQEATRAAEARLRTLFDRFAPTTADQVAAVTATRLRAVREAAIAGGRHPLIVGALRPLATTITNEYLAGHGYVVAMIRGERQPDPEQPGAALEIAVRDMEFAIPELRKRPDVDPAALGALGYSGSGFSQVLLAMRHPDMDAVCDLESAIFDDRVLWPLSRGWGYDPSAMRAAFLHVYGVPLAARENRFADFEAMRYAPRYHFLADAPGLDHMDFATEGMAASLLQHLRGDRTPRLRQVFETANRYLLAFFDAYVKLDRRGLAFLRADPAANGVPEGLLRLRALDAVEPAPSADTFVGLVHERGIRSAMQSFAEARARDPQAALFTEATLNRVGYRLLRGGRGAEAVAVLRETLALHPRSPNAHDSLSEALEQTGASAEAVRVAERGLALLDEPGISPGDREAFGRMLRERIARIRR